MSERLPDAGDADATIALPTPGRRRRPYAHLLDRQAAPADLASLGGISPLAAAANPILAAVPQIRHALRHPDPAGLRARLTEQLEAFAQAARAARIPEAHLEQARFALAALLDDSAAATPWGRDWAKAGPLAGGADAGTAFFARLDELMAMPEANRELLEFFYLCLALGFEGRYRGGEGGRQGLAQLRERVYGLLVRGRGAATPELSARWQGAGVRARRVSGGLVLWAAASGCAMLLAALYFGYRISLGELSDPVATELARLKPVALAPRAVAPAVPATAPAGPRLSEQIAEAIGLREVAVTDAGRGVAIALRSDQLFPPGSARLDAALHPVIERIAGALDRLPGTIVVTGHTDNVPIRSSRYPSNWELSAERARSVVELMRAKLSEPGRLRAEGLADSHPIAPNADAAGRARNRRVEIFLRTGA